MLGGYVSDLREIILLLHSFKLGEVCKVVASLLLENGAELLLGGLNFGERGALVLAPGADSSPACEHDVEVSHRVMHHLELVEVVLSVDTVLEVHFGQVGVPRLGTFAVDRMPLVKLTHTVARHQLLDDALILLSFSLFLFLCLLHENF